MINPHDYSISVRRGEFDGEVCFEARVKELPDLVDYADSFEEAYVLAIDSIETTMEIFAEKGRSMPVPSIPSDNFSGRVTLRLPKSLHRALAATAEDEGISLNQYLTSVLSYYSGFANAPAKASSGNWSPLKKPISQERPRPELKLVKKESCSLRKEVTMHPVTLHLETGLH